MINFIKINKSDPYAIFKKHFDLALNNNQPSINAISISSFNKNTSEVESRYVNLKIIKDNEWIFFSNYNSKKSEDFKAHNQISALLYWDSINIQIRIKATIKKTTREFNKEYFLNRSHLKNALAISSNQSKPIDSYQSVIDNYNKISESANLRECPEFWGGYSFTPYYFEFWEGHSSRLNKRDVYIKNGNNWDHTLLQP
jgi:pyridoxamine 5'-phosphate oxidase|tara:strand:- start:458 stop:1054 length:597 start_codon:yes stop_codon:yes gene_type:complete